MSVFRPAAKVTGPDGREWEIYAYKLNARDRPRIARRRLVRRLLVLGRAAARSLRSDDWTIDAVSYLPARTVYRWTTTGEFKGQVLAQVEGHLARGDVPVHLGHAAFHGERRSARYRSARG